MTRESLVFLFGVIIFLVPYLGVPDAWKLYTYAVSGIALMFIGYSLRHSAYRRSIEKQDGELETDSFAETAAPAEEIPVDEAMLDEIQTEEAL